MRATIYLGFVFLAMLHLAMVTPDPSASPTTASAFVDDLDDDDDGDDALVLATVLPAPLELSETVSHLAIAHDPILRDVIFRLDRPPRA